jgi:HD-GYP domain-containing protein (c-di-GMP phosphodiesterase class II)
VRLFELLETHLDHIPESAWMVAYQMHERCDGTGYPRQRKAEEIHLLARIASVADAFVALVAPRPHRSGLLSYYAIAKLLKDASAGKFDANVVRHLLQVVSLFPLGSYVELNDNRVGRVLRASERYDRPVIELWDRGSIDPPGAIVDLSQEPNLRIMRPLPALR